MIFLLTAIRGNDLENLELLVVNVFLISIMFATIPFYTSANATIKLCPYFLAHFGQVV